jgi:hypothetical protein
MKLRISCAAIAFFSLVLSMAAQIEGSNTAVQSAQVPRLVRFGAALKDEFGSPLAGTLDLTFSLYSEQTGGTPLWQETQSLTLDASGHYSALLGSTQPNGVPLGLFTSGEAQWLGVQLKGQPEQARVMLVSTPYALKAADAETIGGLPPSAFALASPPPGVSPGEPAVFPYPATSIQDFSLPSKNSGDPKATSYNSDYGNGVIYASVLPGTGNGDIGDRVMQAYNQYCLASGCRIRIAPNAGGCWSYTTPIDFNVEGKPATLEGDPGGASCILFTPSTGTAVLLDWGLLHLFGAGVRDLTILGTCTASSGGVPSCSGVTSQGLVLGLHNGVDGAFISNVNVGRSQNGFLTGIVTGGQGLITGYLAQFLNDTAVGNAVGVLESGAVENTKWIGGSISGNGIGLSITAGGSDVGFEYISFDANSTCAVSLTGNSDLTLKSDHFENPSNGTNCWLVATNGDVVWAYGDIFDDVATGTANAPITFGGNSFVFDHVPVVTAGRAIPEIINFTGNALAWLTPFNKNYIKQPLDYIYSGPQGRVFYLPLYGATVEVPADLSFYSLKLDSVSLGGGQKIANSSNIVQFVGTIASTASAGDNLSVSGLTSSGHCSAQATNSVGAGLTGVYIATGSGVATLYHSPMAGGTFNLFCSFD